MAKAYLTLMLGDPTPANAGWSVNASVLVGGEGRKPLAHQMVDFYLDDGAQVVEGKIRKDGRVTVEFTGIPAGTHTVQAQLRGTTFTSQRLTFSIEKHEPPRATKLSILPSGCRGSFLITLTALTDEKVPVEGATIVVIDEANASDDPVELTTGTNGSVAHQVHFTEPEKRLSLSIEGAPETRRTIVLYGSVYGRKRA